MASTSDSAPAIQPYKIAVPDATLERLQTKLSLTTFPQETDFSDDWEYGAPLTDIKRLVGAWRETYDWRRAEAELNAKLPQFTTKVSVDGHGDLKIHFVHKRSDSPDAIPLLFCHGWPGSFLEVQKILPLLTAAAGEDGEPSFHVVAPSLPNFGFSQATAKPGFGLPQYAEACHKLMLRLGYARYVTQGGDWGFLITRAMGRLYPAHVLGSHLNMVHTAPPSPLRNPLLALQHALGRYTAAEKAGLERSAWFRARGSGYNQIQGTKPHTPGFALADSPAALLAWVYEKLRDWTDAYPWADDEVLTWVCIYAFADAGADASVRIYYEAMRGVTPERAGFLLPWNGAVPLGLSYFPRDVVVLPSAWGRAFLGPVAHERRHDRGGHFAAYEVPELLVADVKEVFGGNGVGAAIRKALAS
ncbi:alpha/beta-hydrolase [Hypoxylon cercidicola]|nr:alpha/beta-hydrolase [Hypoxylon cercidicola]